MAKKSIAKKRKYNVRGKYDPDSFPEIVEYYARRGCDNPKIAEKLGIALGTFLRYLKKYPAMSQALRDGRRPVLKELEDAYLKLALGHFLSERKITEVPAKGGDKTSYTTKTVKQVSPNEKAAWKLLKKYDPENWGDDDEDNVESGDSTLIQIFNSIDGGMKVLPKDEQIIDADFEKLSND